MAVIRGLFYTGLLMLLAENYRDSGLFYTGLLMLLAENYRDSY